MSTVIADHLYQNLKYSGEEIENFYEKEGKNFMYLCEILVNFLIDVDEQALDYPW